MTRAIKIRLSEELSAWLSETACQTGSSEQRVIIRTLEKTMAMDQGWRRLAGRIRGQTERPVLAPRFRDWVMAKPPTV